MATKKKVQIDWPWAVAFLGVIAAAVLALVLGGSEVAFFALLALAGGQQFMRPALRMTTVPAEPEDDDDEPDTNPGGIRRRGFARVRTLVDIVGLLLVVFLGSVILVIAGCGASAEEVRQTACTATRLACTACNVAEDRYCGGEPVITETEDNSSGGECAGSNR